MTYIPTRTGFLYLAVVIDAFRRKVVGWSMGELMTADLVLAALHMALHTRRPDLVIHHSAQYTSIAFGSRCKEMGVRPLDGHRGGRLRQRNGRELLRQPGMRVDQPKVLWKSQAEARTALFTWIEGWYNPRRRHSALNYLSPINFQRRHVEHEARLYEHGLPTASVGSSQAPTAAVDNAAPLATRPQST